MIMSHSSLQRLSVSGMLSEPDGRLRRRPGSVRSPGADLRRGQRSVHHRHRGGLQCYRQVRSWWRFCLIRSFEISAPTELGWRVLSSASFCMAAFLFDVLRISFLSYREKLLDFLWSLKQPDGSFMMHVGGEVDVRWEVTWSCFSLSLSFYSSAFIPNKKHEGVFFRQTHWWKLCHCGLFLTMEDIYKEN